MIQATGFKRARKQAGVALPIALIMLVAMILAALALFRSVDTATMVAGNLSYKQRTVHAGDEGIRAAYLWIQGKATVSPASLNSSDLGAGYYSNQHADDPNWNPVTSWPGSGTYTLPTDSGGNTVSYVIHRLCTLPGLTPNQAGNRCATYSSSSTTAPGGSLSSDAPAFANVTYVYLRVTAKVVGPRNSVSYIQSMMLVPYT
jgi:type IV pilus assembly protein PilX